jgi:hypothetical protein
MPSFLALALSFGFVSPGLLIPERSPFKDLQSDSFSRARGACDKAVAVRKIKSQSYWHIALAYKYALLSLHDLWPPEVTTTVLL